MAETNIEVPVATGTTDQQMWYKVKGDDGQWYKVQSTTPALAKAKVWQITSKAAVAGKKVTQPSADIGRYVEASKPWPSQPQAAPTQPPPFMQRVGTRMQGNLNPMNLMRLGNEAAAALSPVISHPMETLFGPPGQGTQAFKNPITNVMSSAEKVLPKVLESVGLGLSQYKDPANIVGDVATAGLVHTATTGELPKIPTEKMLDSAIKHELKKAETLNVRALKPEDMTKPTGSAVAAAKIWGTKNKLPGLLRQRINQNNAITSQAARAADQTGVTLDVSKELDAAVDAARARPAFMGDKKALSDITAWKQRLSQPIVNPQTGATAARQWAKLKPSEALEMSRGLERDSGWEASPPDHIVNVATAFRKSLGDKLDTASPGIAALRKQNSGLIEAEKSAIKLRDISVKEQGRAIVHWLSQPSISKLILTVGMMEILKESGVAGGSYLFAAGGAMGLRAMAESMVSRTGRAALHQEAAEILMGLRRPAAARGGAPPTAGTAPPIAPAPQTPTGGPQAPVRPPSGPTGPQVAAPQQLTSGTPPVAPIGDTFTKTFNTYAYKGAPPVPKTVTYDVPKPGDTIRHNSGDLGTVRRVVKASNGEPLVIADIRGRTDVSISIDQFSITKRASETKQSAPNTPESSAWHNEALQMAREKLPNATLSEQLQEAARIQKAGPSTAGAETKVSAKAKALTDAIPELQSRYDNAKSGYERERAKINLESAKKALESGDPKEMQVVKRRLDVARYQRTAQEKAKVLAPQAPTPTGATRIAEPASPALSPEAVTISIEDGYHEIEAMGEVKLHGETINTKLLVKGLRARLKAKEPLEEMAAVQEILERLRKETK